ncbi:tRNA threonylcarbamoyladenosine dehydratase [Poriferisphaera corsica]|uniref:tRNA threonylcarbamoyladenosine dehydratase n=1 Tax=Poriferisphaera corsica TaxID=2528020 RepID=A0A517YYB2_9BACT|nr:tRNA threonylcarbamoyladenosine dehydratase [Poriferisphaera corsica]QDU35214.1 tRNA threonylcarbamoyladenosine dehydratase [Poriferisphaera corsica]
MEDRFARTRRMIGDQGVEQLQNSFVVVIGLGAVGSFAAEALVRAGIGHIRLVDFDTVSPSNLNRQLYALESTIGQKKTEVARTRCLDINRACNVEMMDCFFNDETADDVLGDLVSKDFGGSSLVIDAIDSLWPKIELAWQCYDRGLRLVSSMGAAMRWDSDAVHVSRAKKTRRCGLAKDLRKQLRKRHREEVEAGRCWRQEGVCEHWCVWSDELMSEVKDERMADIDAKGELKHRTMGSLPTLTGMFGLRCAHVGLELLLGQRED